MRIHAILCVRDEGDIIAQSLAAALVWADAIHIYDTGSTDDTWTTVQDLASREPRLHPIAREEVIFDCDTRGYVFELAKHTFAHGDWVCRMDADEFYHVDPREFLANAVATHEGRVCTQQYEFVLTKSEAEAWAAGRETLADRARPIEDRRRHYYVDRWAELRFTRFRRTMRWGRGHNLPYSPGVVALERLPLRHYRYRDPVQMDARCRLRAAMEKISHHAKHWRVADWQAMVYADNNPRLLYWEPGTALPPRRGLEHLYSPKKRAAQRVMYALGLPYLTDLFRPGWKKGEKPDPIPAQPA